jgi:hypothetical protein
MRINNQAKVGLASVLCLLGQGYVFTYILGVEPGVLVSIAPIFPYIVYIYARASRQWYYNKPFYWIAAIVAITLIDLAPYALELMEKAGLRPA